MVKNFLENRKKGELTGRMFSIQKIINIIK